MSKKPPSEAFLFNEFYLNYPPSPAYNNKIIDYDCKYRAKERKIAYLPY